MASKLWFLKTPSSGREVYYNVVATKNFKSTKPYLVMKQQHALLHLLIIIMIILLVM